MKPVKMKLIMKPLKMQVGRVKYYYNDLSFYINYFASYQLKKLKNELNVIRISNSVYSQVQDNIK